MDLEEISIKQVGFNVCWWSFGNHSLIVQPVREVPLFKFATCKKDVRIRRIINEKGLLLNLSSTYDSTLFRCFKAQKRQFFALQV